MAKLNLNFKEVHKEVKDEIYNILAKGGDPTSKNFLVQSGLKNTDAEKEAKRIIGNPTVKMQLCKVLKHGATDIWDFSKNIVSALLPMIIAGTITVVLKISLVLAVISVILFRMGVSLYCNE